MAQDKEGAGGPVLRPAGAVARGEKGATGATTARIMTAKEIADQDLVTTILRASEMVAGAFQRATPPAPPVAFATPEDYDESRIPNDFRGLASVLEQIRAVLAHDPRLAHQASQARAAFGDGETLRVLFHNLFPGQKSTPYHNPDGSAVLTLTEVEVLRQAACDIGREEIGKRLNMAPRTVGTHFDHIYKKLNVQRPIQAVARAISMGYLDVDVFQFIGLAANAGVRNYRLFDTLTAITPRIDHAPFDATLRPIAEFGLLLLLLAGQAAEMTNGNAHQSKMPHAIVCQLDIKGKIVRTFGQGHLSGSSGITVAPPHAARQGFRPGNLFVQSAPTTATGLNRAVIHEFTPDGRHVRAFGGGQEIGTRLSSGISPAFHSDGRLLVPTGCGTDAVLAFRRNGAVVRRLAEIICGGVCAGLSGKIYAVSASSAGNHVRVYDAKGKRLHTIGQTPAGVGYVGLAINSRGHIWVNRNENEEHTLQEFAPNGNLLRTLPLPGLGDAQLTTDSQDRLYVPCPRSGDIKILTPDGKVVQRFALCGQIVPSAVAIGPENQLYVVGIAH